jgi:phenylpyruvate tautomerase PptA (4-oxalocrotonate tautomerase family)
MPIMDLTYPADTFQPAQRTELADTLTSVLLRAERAPDTEFFRNITWVYMHEMPEGTLLAAGSPVAEPTFRLQVTVPQGALSERRKGELVSEATKVIMAAASIDDSESLRVWVLINEVPEGNWGAAGNVVHFEQLRQVAAQEREQRETARPAEPVA